MAEGEWTEESVRALLITPFSAVTVAPSLCVAHEPLVDRATWVGLNARLIAELGAEAWLGRLLDVLESGGPGLPAEAGPPEARPPGAGRRYRLAKRRG